MWWGKIIGAFIGYLLAGWSGALIGLILGHISDIARHRHAFSSFINNHPQIDQVRQAFFDSTFLIMGHVAKADGRVDEEEINAARNVMHRLNLNDSQRIQAMRLFNEGKSPEFDLDSTVTQLIKFCHGNFIMLHIFADIQLQAARSSGWITNEKQKVLQRIFQRIGYVPFEFYFSQARSGYQQQSSPFSQIDKVTKAYAQLGVTESSSNDEIKKAYRKLMSQHHPDKLMAKGIPEEMMKMATEKAQNIQLAYDLIRERRGF